jgi:hypothetical protein
MPMLECPEIGSATWMRAARRRVLYEAGQIFLCLWYTA